MGGAIFPTVVEECATQVQQGQQILPATAGIWPIQSDQKEPQELVQKLQRRDNIGLKLFCQKQTLRMRVILKEVETKDQEEEN